MQRKGFFLLALICGLIAAGSMYIYLNKASQSQTFALKPLVRAKTNIQARTVITASQLEVVEIPIQGYPQGGFSTIQSVEGSVALINLNAGDLVVNAMVEHQSIQTNSDGKVTGSTTSLTVPNGKRAVAVPIGLVSGVGYAVKPGDHVDVMVTIEIKDPNVNTQSFTTTTLAAQDVLVLSVGDAKDEKAKVETKSYILALSVPQALAVTHGSEKGTLRLMLRNPLNAEIRQDAPFSEKNYMDPNYTNNYK